jgi:hypothetical protein
MRPKRPLRCFRFPFGIANGLLGVQEQIFGELVGDDAVDLLGHRAVEGAQARLQVGDRDGELDGDERRGERRVDVAGDDHEIRALLDQDGLDAFHHARGLDGVAGGAHAEHVVGRRHPELLREDVAHQPVVVLPGVDQRVATLRHSPP